MATEQQFIDAINSFKKTENIDTLATLFDNPNNTTMLDRFLTHPLIGDYLMRTAIRFMDGKPLVHPYEEEFYTAAAKAFKKKFPPTYHIEHRTLYSDNWFHQRKNEDPVEYGLTMFNQTGANFHRNTSLYTMIFDNYKIVKTTIDNPSKARYKPPQIHLEQLIPQKRFEHENDIKIFIDKDLYQVTDYLAALNQVQIPISNDHDFSFLIFPTMMNSEYHAFTILAIFDNKQCKMHLTAVINSWKDKSWLDNLMRQTDYSFIDGSIDIQRKTDQNCIFYSFKIVRALYNLLGSDHSLREHLTRSPIAENLGSVLASEN
jgi:hypothetical protein